MKMIKIALLGTAAVAAFSVSARADELSDLKAQIEALNSRVAQVETAPAVPAGYQLLSISKGKASATPGMDADKYYGENATIVSIMPTADVPASTSVEWNGFVRAALVYDEIETALANDDESDISVRSRIQAQVKGKTETAVGVVGVNITFRANANGFGDPGVSVPDGWGYWSISDELTLGGGYAGSLSGIGYGYDGKCNCHYTDNADAGYGHGDTTQMRLSYASGPLGFAIALEDDGADSLGAAGEISFKGDMISGEISGGYWESDDAWVGAGIGFDLDMFSVSMSAGFGEVNNDDFWKANVLAKASLSDAVSMEVGFNYRERDFFADQTAVLAGFYYDPVDQLTIGLEGEYIMNDGNDNDRVTVDLVTVYRF